MFKKLLFALVFLGTNLSLFAESITKYDIEIVVEQSGELAIKESIEYNFANSQKHGMFRDIPFTIKHNSRVIDLGLYDFTVTMDGQIVEWTKSTMGSYQAGETIRIKVGSASRYVTGKHLYTINYRVKKGVLPIADKDSLDAIRWNIVGTGWNVPLANITANFFLPAALSESNINLSTFTGRYGNIDSTATSKWINPHQVQVHIEKLDSYAGATVELAYPAKLLAQHGKENVKASFLTRLLENLHWGVFLGFLVYLRKVYKEHTDFKDKRSIAVQYEAPEGLSLLQSGLLLDKFTDNEDFSAAILELGTLGHLEITQKHKKNKATLLRIKKDKSTLTADQRFLMERVLFRGGSSSFSMATQSKSKANALKEGFAQINNDLYQWSVDDGYIMGNAEKIRHKFLLHCILWLIPFLTLALYATIHNVGLILFSLIFITVGLTLVVGSKEWLGRFFGLPFLLGGIIPMFNLGSKDLNLYNLLLSPVGILLFIVIIMIIIYRKIGKFSQKGAYIQTHLLGLKMFISRVKEDEIKRRLALDPLYLEKLLPYAILFNESKHWLKFYDALHMKTPQWYHGNVHNVTRLSSELNSASTAPASSSSSSFGGGGFSGGGSSSGGGGGGGGGGSW